MSDINIDMPVQQGWQCPICKRVYSPFTPMCYYCGKKDTSSDDQITYGSGTVLPPKNWDTVYCDCINTSENPGDKFVSHNYGFFNPKDLKQATGIVNGDKEND